MSQAQATLHSDPELCRVTLRGPATSAAKRSVLSPWPRSEWRELIIELRVGSQECPDWAHANLCLTAVQDLIKMSDGLLTNEVVNALKAHVNVVSYQSFRGR